MKLLGGGGQGAGIMEKKVAGDVWEAGKEEVRKQDSQGGGKWGK